MGEAPRLPERWTIGARIHRDRWVTRWSAVDVETRRPVEVWVLTAPTARPAPFLAVYRALRDAGPLPGAPEVVDVLDTPPAVVLEPLSPHTAHALRGPVPPSAVGPIAAVLIPTVQALGPTLLGHIGLRDLAVRRDGRLCVCPRTLVGPSVAKRIGDLAAPEAFTGAEPTTEMALYGLGSALFILATGRQPKPDGPPPRAFVPALPSTVEACIEALRASSPVERRTALALLEPDPGAAVPNLLPQLRARTELGPTSTALVPAGGLDRPYWGVWATAAKALEPSRFAILAALAELRVPQLQDLVERGLPVLLDHSESPSALRRRIQRAEAAGIEGQWLSTDRGWGRVFGGGLVVATIAQAAAGASLVFAGGFPLAGLFAIGAATTGAAATLTVTRSIRAHRHARATSEAAQWIHAQHRLRAQHPPLSRVVGFLHEARLLSTELPTAMQHDVRDTLMQVDRCISELEAVLRAGEDVQALLVRPDVEAQLRRGVRADQAARASAHLDDSERRRARVYGWLADLEPPLHDLVCHLDPERDADRLAASLHAALTALRKAVEVLG